LIRACAATIVCGARQHSVPHDKISKIQGLALSGRKSFVVFGKSAARRVDNRGHTAGSRYAVKPRAYTAWAGGDAGCGHDHLSIHGVSR
jgi:hypothetical protein